MPAAGPADDLLPRQPGAAVRLLRVLPVAVRPPGLHRPGGLRAPGHLGPDPGSHRSGQLRSGVPAQWHAARAHRRAGPAYRQRSEVPRPRKGVRPARRSGDTPSPGVSGGTLLVAVTEAGTLRPG